MMIFKIERIPWAVCVHGVETTLPLKVHSYDEDPV